MLIVGVLANLGLIILFAAEKKEFRLIESWQPYESRSAGFSVMYPKGWRVMEFNRYDIEFEARFCRSPESYVSAVASLEGSVMVGLLKHGRASRDPLKMYHEKLVAGSEGRFRHFKSLETVEMKVAGMEAYGTSFSYRTWNGLMGRAMKGMVVSTWNGDHYIALQFVCPAREHDTMFAVFGTFLQGFKPEKVVLDEGD